VSGQSSAEHERPSRRDASTWLVLLLAVAFLVIGILFIAVPRPAAIMFGIPAEGPAEPYIRAIGFRDLALALYLAGLTLLATRRAVATVLGASVLIPVCDVALVMLTTGLSSPGSLALHAAGGTVLATLALWMRR
jgi:Domain of unknown function (DUF4267)